MAEQTEGEEEYGILSGKVARLTGMTATYVVFYGLLLCFVIFLCQQGYRFCYEVFGPTVVRNAPGEEIVFQVKEEDTLQSISERLKEEGLIVSRKSFYLRIKLMVSDKQELRPGVYKLRTDMDYTEIINELTVSEGITP